MAVAKMRHIECVGMQKDKAEILERLQNAGAVHLSAPYEEIPSDVEEAGEAGAIPARNTSAPAVQEIDAKRQKISTVLDLLAPYDIRKKHLFKALRDVEADAVDKALANEAELLELCDSVLSIESRIHDAEQESAQADIAAARIAPWKEFPYSLSDSDSKFTCTEFLFSESRKNYEAFLEELCSSGLRAGTFEMDKNSKSVYFALAALKEDLCKVQELYNLFGVRIMDLSGFSGTPAEAEAACRAEKKAAAEKAASLREDYKASGERMSELEELYDGLGMRKEKLLADERIADSSLTFILSGWVPEKAETRIRNILTQEFRCHVVLRDPLEGELPPTKLENGPLGGSLEPVEAMYSILKYGEVDPSTVAAFFFALFFGFMLSDAGYGIILTLATAVILIKCKLKENMRKYMTLFLASGISTVFWGAIFGSWFGNLIPTVTAGAFALKPIWFDPQDSANINHFLAFTLLLGVIHLFTALAVKAVNFIAKGKWLDAVFDVLFWYVFYIGEILFLLPYIPYYGETAFCQRFHKYGLPLLGIGFLLILFTKGRKSSNPFVKVFGGITCLYSLIDMLSDCLSYTRLMAMGLATSVIINVFNSIAASAAGLDQGITIRFIAFVIIFIAANLFNFAINALSAYVNACRLTYIEFFGKFYEGDGKEYAPLCYNTEYINIISSGGNRS